MGSDDEAYNCIYQQEDSEGMRGVKLDKVSRRMQRLLDSKQHVYGELYECLQVKSFGQPAREGAADLLAASLEVCQNASVCSNISAMETIYAGADEGGREGCDAQSATTWPSRLAMGRAV